MEQKAGTCEIAVTANINVKGYEYVKLTVGFSEPYDPSVEGSREAKYYELLEAVQCRFMELSSETTKTIAVVKKEIKQGLALDK